MAAIAASRNSSMSRTIDRLDDTIRTVKQCHASYKSQHDKERRACLHHMRRGDDAKVRVSAESAVRNLTAARNYDKLLMRLQSVRQFLVKASVNRAVTDDLSRVVRTVNRLSNLSNPTKTMSVMERFDAMCENVSVVEGVLDQSMQTDNSAETDRTATDEMIARVALEYRIDPSYAGRFVQSRNGAETYVPDASARSAGGTRSAETHTMDLLDTMPDVPRMDPN